MSYYRDVGDFHRKFGLPNDADHGPEPLAEDVLRFRVNFLMEELAEFCDNHGADVTANALRWISKELPHRMTSGVDLAEAADALADLVYVALGTAQLMGLPFDKIWNEVQRANMTKVRASGAADPRSKRAHVLDVVKPPGFQPPDHRPAIQAARQEADLEASFRRHQPRKE